jgi:peptidoglycan/LPS O-acetylase OafA/YrhL
MALANLGFVIFGFNVFIQVPNWYDIYYGFKNFDDTQNTLIIGFQPILMSLGFSLAIIPIMLKPLGFLTRFLISRTWDILGRLTYCACLCCWTVGGAFHYGVG